MGHLVFQFFLKFYVSKIFTNVCFLRNFKIIQNLFETEKLSKNQHKATDSYNFSCT